MTMNYRQLGLGYKKMLALPIILALTSTAHAELTTYASAASFSSTLSTKAVDTFSDLNGSVPGVRNIGDFSYSLSSYVGLSTVQVGNNTFARPNQGYDWVNFFPVATSAIGGNFFGADVFGNFKAGGITVRVFDSLGADQTFTFTPGDAGASSFFGVVSSGTITRLMVHANQGWTPSYLGIDNVTLGTVAAVPEPSSIAMFMVGIFSLSALSRRRKNQSTQG